MIKNLTKNKLIAEDYKLCDTFFSKFRGLMFSKKNNLIFLFNKEKKVELHMFFVWFPIDVVLLDNHKKVVEIKDNFKPFTFFRSKNKAKYVLELFSGAIEQSNIELEDKINF